MILIITSSYKRFSEYCTFLWNCQDVRNIITVITIDIINEFICGPSSERIILIKIAATIMIVNETPIVIKHKRTFFDIILDNKGFNFRINKFFGY